MNFTNPTLVTLTAPTCSGKSYLLNELTSRGIFSRIVSTTTRDPRPGERAAVDYDFISVEKSKQMEAAGEFFELIEFNGVRYGVTYDQMRRAMACDQPPIVILEPQGLKIYEEKCREHGWDIFKIYVHVTEDEKLKRLKERTEKEMHRLIDNLDTGSAHRYSAAFNEVARENAKAALSKMLAEHQRRTLLITGDERRWSNVTSWDAIVPGDDVEKAISMIEQGIKWRNRKVVPPQAIGQVELPLIDEALHVDVFSAVADAKARRS